MISRTIQKVGLFSFVFAMLLMLGSATSTTLVGAAPAPAGVVTFNDADGVAVTCNVVLDQGDPYSSTDPIFGTNILNAFSPGGGSMPRSTSLITEAEDDTSPLNKIWQKLNNQENMIYAYFVGVSTTNDFKCGDYGFLVQSPDNPTAFVGTGLRDLTSDPMYDYLFGEYNPTTKSFRLNNGGRGRLGGWSVIKNNDQPIASDVSFGTGNGGGGGGGNVEVGPCAGITSPPAVTACLSLQFIDFIHISFRDEVYRLNEWEGNKMSYFMIDSYDPARKAKNTFKPDCSPYFEFSTGTENGQLDIDIDGDSGDSDQIEDFILKMNSLPTTFTGGNYQDYDLDCNEIADDHFQSTDGTPSYMSLVNMRRMLSYFSAEKRIAFIEHLDPAGNEAVVANLIFDQDTANPNLFKSGKVYDSCGLNEGFATITVSGDMTTMTPNSWRSAVLKIPSDGCSSYLTDFNVFVKGAALGETVAENTPGGVATTAPDEADVPEKTCSSEGGGLGWIICPVLVLLDEGSQKLEEIVRGYLFIGPERFDRDADGAGLYRSWSVFRGLATVIIVIIALLMIFSQAMGDGIFDNYSVKKILPRLLLAGIAIQLSWFLLTQLVNIFNILGNGISGLLLSPFKYVDEGGVLTSLTPDTNLRDILPTSSAGGQGVLAAVVIGGGIALVGAALTIGLGALGALLVAFITLVLRNMVIFLGVVMSPIAIAMSVLPGTQKTSKWWWESLEKALLMYPLMMAVLAGGKIVAHLLIESSNPDEGLGGATTLAVITAWFGSFAAAIAILKKGGDALNKISGFTGDKTKGMFDRANNYANKRKEFNKKIKDNALAMKAGEGSRIASARVRFRGGQPISGWSPRKSRREAIERTFEGLQSSAAEQATKEADAVLRKSAAYNSRGGNSELVRIARTAKTSAERQAAIDRIATIRDEEAMRALLLDPGSGGKELLGAVNSGKLAAQFGDAPDISKAEVDPSTGRVSAKPIDKPVSGPKTYGWGKDTWEIALRNPANHAHYRDMLESNPEAAANIDAEKLAAIQSMIGGAPIVLARHATSTPGPGPAPAPPLPPPGPTPPPPPPPVPSDIRLKKDIHLVGITNGHNVYSFRYIWSDILYEGVMAQEVMNTHPEAVTTNENGYMFVHYDLIGIKFRKIRD